MISLFTNRIEEFMIVKRVISFNYLISMIGILRTLKEDRDAVCYTSTYKLQIVLTVQIIDSEEEDEFFVAALTSKFVHCINEFGHGDGAIAIAVKNSEGPLHEKWLQFNQE